LHFYTLNAAAIARAVGLREPEPYVLVAMGPQMGSPERAHDFPELPNNHLGYALTWFSFALIDWIIFVIWVRKNWQRTGK
jgi:cytochrome oxidase assembly protein ShyY1